MSFPMPGYTLALDFAIRPALFPLLDELDAMVAEYGGRLYLAKDARMSRGMFMKTYPAAASYRRALAMLHEGGTRLASLQSDRIGLTD